MNKLKVVYENGEMETREESPLVPGYFEWDRIPDKKIVRMEMVFRGMEASVLLTGYDAYNLIVQRDARALLPLGMWLMGKMGDLVSVVYLDFLREEIRRDYLPLGRELENGATLGWREGFAQEGSTPGTFVIPLKGQ